MMRGIVVLALALLADTAGAYTHVVHEQNDGFVALAWPRSTQPIHFALNDQTAPLLPNVVPGSDPHAAVLRALLAWPAASAVELQSSATSIASAGRDGTNLISFANTAANAAQLELAGDPIGLTLYFFVDAALVEADVLFNPGTRFTTTAASEDELEAQDAADIEAVAVHELGHAIGLHHSGIESASMWGFTSLGQRSLDPDDVSGARALYGEDEGSRVRGFEGPSRDPFLGLPLNPRTLEPLNPASVIAGTVRVNGQPAFGAQVVAVAADGPVRGALTLPNGNYRIAALPPGSYTLYVEPLDGPHGSAFVDGCVRFGDMGGAGIFDAAALTTNFSTTFYGGNGLPLELTLDPDHLVLADFDLPAGTSELNPVRIGPGTPNGAFTRLAEIPLALAAATTQWVAVAGPGLDLVDDASLRVVGGGVSIDTANVQRPGVSCGGSQLPTLILPVQVAADAVAGGRTLLVASGDDLAAFSGALDIQAPTTRPACVGDCNDNRAITIDELVRGVNISLGRTPLDTCSDFDRDGNLRVTVDELIAGVNGVLAGCA